jgi:hypothetical protein
MIFASGIFAAGFAWLLIPHLFYDIFFPTKVEHVTAYALTTLSVMTFNLTYPIAFPALASLWAFPLLAWFWRGRTAPVTSASWAFLDPPSEKLLPRFPSAPLRPGIPILMGIVTGLLFCATLFIVRVVLNATRYYDVIKASDTNTLIWFYGQIVTALLMQMVIAMIVAGWVKQSGWAHGLFSAFTAGCVMAVGLLGLNLLFKAAAGDSLGFFVGGGLEPAFIGTVFSQIVNWGALLSLLPAIGVSAMSDWMRRRK